MRPNRLMHLCFQLVQVHSPPKPKKADARPALKKARRVKEPPRLQTEDKPREDYDPGEGPSSCNAKEPSKVSLLEAVVTTKFVVVFLMSSFLF